MNREIVVDIDGILTKETEGFGPEFYPKRTPIKYNIDTLINYKERGFKIILYSARYEEDYRMTKTWLEKYNVPYDKLILGKPQGHQYIDDRATNQLDREILCFSGGVDSVIAWHYLDKPTALYSMLNHRYQEKEFECILRLKKVMKDLTVYFIDGPDMSKHEYGELAYISQRNLQLTLNASHYGNKIYVCGIKGDMVEDKTPEAFRVMSFAMNFIQKPTEPQIKIESPFWQMTKTDIIKWFLDNYPQDYVEKVLKTSVSCYDSRILLSCGECPSCFRKWIALESAGIKSFDWFTKDIRKWKGIEKYKDRIKKGYYDIKRSQETQEVLEKYNLW